MTKAARMLALALTAAPLCAGAASADAPPVFVTIKPVHSLVASVMRGVGSPYLLLKGGTSPHAYAMRPSEARRLSKARLVFWVGEQLEAFLEKPLSALGGQATVVALHDVDGMRLLKTRKGGVWEADRDHDEDNEHGHEHKRGDGHEHGGYDMHVWLDPRNAQAMVRAIASALAKADPPHAEVYQANAEATRRRLVELEGDLRRRLAPVRDRRFIVFHDAYQYFEARFGLAAAGSLTLTAQTAPGARRIGRIRARIKAAKVRCIFVEPQFSPRLAETVIAGSGARKATLDPLGAEISAGPDAYFLMMRKMAAALRSCLAS